MKRASTSVATEKLATAPTCVAVIIVVNLDNDVSHLAMLQGKRIMNHDEQKDIDDN